MAVRVEARYEDEMWLRDDRTSLLSFSWNLAHTVNVWDHDEGTNLDVFSVGDFARGAATMGEVREAIEEYVTDMLRDAYEITAEAYPQRDY